MKVLNTLIVALIFLITFSSASQTGIAVLTTGSNSPTTITGTVTFTQDGSGNVTVKAYITGLKDGQYAIHVHEYGDITNSTGSSVGGHYVGEGSNTHGCPTTDVRHEGDMGSWTCKGGKIDAVNSFNLLQLSGGYSIIGRAVVVHQYKDSCGGDTGDAGARWAFGVIGIANVEGEENTANQTVNGNLICRLQNTTNCNGCQGTVWFEKYKDAILVTARIEGLALGSVHGIHVHHFGDMSKPDGTGAGTHWDPTSAVHGLPSEPDRHYGDMGNVQNYEGSVAWYQYTNTLIPSLSSIVGRAVVVHFDKDHGRGANCDAYGSAGSRVATCAIGYAAPENQSAPFVPIPIVNNWSDSDCPVAK